MEDSVGLRVRVLVSTIWSLGAVLVRLLFVSAVLLTVEFAIAGVSLFAAGFGLVLLAYGYLARWSDRPIEERLLSPPR